MATKPLSADIEQTAAGLHWVRLEIDRSLRNVRQQMEEYLESESPEDHEPLQNAIEDLRQVRGIFSLVGCYGAATLAGEMVHVLDDLIRDVSGDRSAAYDALSGASLQISDYMELLIGGELDRVIVLQPIINELRLVRSQPLVSESELFAIQLQLQGIELHPPSQLDGEGSDITRTTLEVFQQNFLSWYRGRDSTAALKAINRFAEQISYSVHSPALRSMWWALTLLTESISEDPDSSLELKRLLGRVVMQLRTLVEKGETAAELQLGNLPGQLAYYLALAARPSARARDNSELEGIRLMVLSTADLETVRNRLRLPNASVLLQVHQEVRRELQQVKDAIDLLVRTGGRIEIDVGLQKERLEKLASTLGLLGLGGLQTVLANQACTLEDLAPDSPNWIDTATALLRVEDSLEDGLFRAQSRSEFDEFSVVPAALVPRKNEFSPSRRGLDEAVTAFAREALVNLSQIKAMIVECLDTPSPDRVVSISALLGQIAAGLVIIDRVKPARLIETLAQHMELDRFLQIRGDLDYTNALAEAVAAAELYLEALQNGFPQIEGHLKQMAAAVEHLEWLVGSMRAEHADDSTRSTFEEESASSTGSDGTPIESAIVSDHGTDKVSTEQEQDAGKTTIADAEILAVFVEEVTEVLQSLRRDLPELRTSPKNGDLLATVRRAFHTLKGSGRMVGADSIGSLGLAVEQVFNRCLDNNLAAPAKAVEIAEEAVNQIDRLLAGFKAGDDDALNVTDFVARAEAVRDSIDTSEADIYAVFRDDTRERLSFVSRWLDMASSQIAPLAVEAEVLRAFHTLAGSAGIVGLDSAQRLFTAVERYLISCQEKEAGMRPDELVVVGELVEHLRELIGDSETVEIDNDTLQNWLSRLEMPPKLDASGGSGVSDGEGQNDGLIPEPNEESLLAVFDALQQIQTDARNWGQSEKGLARESVVNKLKELASGDAAAGDGFPQLTEALTALAQRLSQLAGPPTQLLTAALEDIFESFYQLLDDRHEGRESSSWARLLDQIAGLPIRVSAQNDAFAQSRPGSTVSDAVTKDSGPDRELLAIFLQEAGELIVEFKKSLAQLECGDVTVGRELHRILHTFKGSARVVGFEELGLLCERYEQSVESIVNSDDRQLVSLAPALAEVSSRLDLLIWEASDSLVNSAVPSEQIPERPDAGITSPIDVQQAEAGPSVTREDESSKLFTSPEGQLDGGGDSFDSVKNSGSVPQSDDIDVTEYSHGDEGLQTDGQLDLELIALFSDEAAELIEQIDVAFERWKNTLDPADLQEIMRALHTLKGGARSAGMLKFGDAAHAFESQLESIIGGGELLDPSTQAALQVSIDRLHEFHDKLTDYQASGLKASSAVVSPADDKDPSPWQGDLFWVPEDEEVVDSRLHREHARVSVDALNAMLNQAGEISIYRSRLEQINNGLQGYISEIDQTIERIRDQLRMLDIETEAQITARGFAADVNDSDRYGMEFDPLEMDRYTRMQELSRALTESVSDMASISASIDKAAVDGESILQQQSQLTTEVHRGLMDALTVPFGRQQSRFERVVRQTSLEYGKQVDLSFQGSDTQIDRNILERVTGSIEHLLRNAVIHGVESPEDRQKSQKPASARIEVLLSRQAEEFVVDVRDDGRGLDFAAIHKRAVDLGLLDASASVSDNDLARFIFEPRFSTASALTQAAGRGLGLDAVSAAIRQLGGTLELRSETDRGTQFLIRLPLTLAITQALVVKVARECYALPISSVVGVTRVPSADLLRRLDADETVVYGGEDHVLRYLGDYLDLPRPTSREGRSRAVIIVRTGEPITSDERRPALVVDELVGSRELIAKPIGQQLGMISGIAGASILADGQPVLLLDIPSLIVEQQRQQYLAAETSPSLESNVVLVVDDSITMRRVAQRVLERAGLHVLTARDGLDAMGVLQSETPTVVLLDIEMPRADGFEVAEFMRNNERLSGVPIIMITSRSGEKHRSRAETLGVNRYLIKPYQEEQLLIEVQALCAAENG